MHRQFFYLEIYFSSWLATIKYCIRSAPGGAEGGGSHLDHNKQDYHSDAPELPPRHVGNNRGSDRLSSNGNFDISPQGEDGN